MSHYTEREEREHVSSDDLSNVKERQVCGYYTIPRVALDDRDWRSLAGDEPAMLHCEAERRARTIHIWKVPGFPNIRQHILAIMYTTRRLRGVIGTRGPRARAGILKIRRGRMVALHKLTRD